MEMTRLSNASSLVRARSDEFEAEVRINRPSSIYNFLLGDPGLDVGSISALVIEAKSLMSAGKLGGELRGTVLKFRPRYLRVDSGLGLGLAVVFFGPVSISFSSSEL